MKTSTLPKTNGTKSERLVVVTAINNLRKREEKKETDFKIASHMSKLHSLWFKRDS